MSQSHFAGGRMNVEPFAQQQQEDGGLNLNREKSVAHVAGAAEYGKEDVRVDIDFHNQQQKKGQGLETIKKSLAAAAEVVEAEHENDHADDNDVKGIVSDGEQQQQQECLNNTTTTKKSATFQKYQFVPSYEEELLHDRHCNACRLAKGAREACFKASFLEMAKQTKDPLPFRVDGISPSKSSHRNLSNAPLIENRANSVPPTRRLPERPKFLPQLSPHELRENFIKNAPYMRGPD